MVKLQTQINRRSNLYNVSISAVTIYLLSEFQNHSFNSSCIRWWLIRCFKGAYSNSSVHVYRRKIPIVILSYNVKMLIKHHKKSKWNIQNALGTSIINSPKIFTCQFLHMAIILSKSVLIARRKWSEGLCMIGQGNPAFEKCFINIKLKKSVTRYAFHVLKED